MRSFASEIAHLQRGLTRDLLLQGERPLVHHQIPPVTVSSGEARAQGSRSQIRCYRITQTWDILLGQIVGVGNVAQRSETATLSFSVETAIARPDDGLTVKLRRRPGDGDPRRENFRVRK